MKLIGILMISVLTISFTGIQSKHKKNTKFEIGDIYQTWKLDQILVNGTADTLGFPVNEIQMTFGEDSILTILDDTYKSLEHFTWKMTGKDTYQVISSYEVIDYKILHLTSAELQVKMISIESEIDLVYFHSSQP